MNQTYARFSDPYGVTGPLVRFGAPCTLPVAKERAHKALARGAVEVEIRVAQSGREFYVGTVTRDRTLFVEDVLHVTLD